MDDREYITKEVLLLYEYILSDGEQFSEKRHLYARILSSIKSTASCQVGGIEQLDLSVQDIKNIIKDVIDNHPKQLNYK